MAVSDDFFFDDSEIDRILNDHTWEYVASSNPLCIVADIVNKADGVFLWTSLVLDGLIERIQAGESIQSIRKHVDDFPPEIEQYIEKLVYARIHSTWCSQTAMVLRIMMFETNPPLNYLWLVLNSEDNSPGSLLNPNFASETPDVTDDLIAVGVIEKKTRQFLSLCCKDLLQIQNTGMAPPRLLDDLPRVVFSHRTVFDFLLTDKMQRLLRAHLPPAFESDLLLVQLVIAASKVGPSSLTWRFRALQHTLLWPCDSAANARVSNVRRLSGEQTLPATLLQECERIALNALKSHPRFNWQHEARLVLVVAVTLALRGYYAVVDKFLELRPGISCIQFNNKYVTDLATTPLLIALGFPPSRTEYMLSEGRWDAVLLQKLLEHGANPAQYAFKYQDYRRTEQLETGTLTLCCSQIFPVLLQHLEHFHRLRECGFSLVQFGWIRRLRRQKHGIMISTPDERPDRSDHKFDVPIRPLSGFSEESLADAVKLLIEHGAELLETVPVAQFGKGMDERHATFVFSGDFMTIREIIEKRIPVAQTVPWRALLDEHCRPERGEELLAKRRHRVKHWPIARLSDDDVSLLGLEDAQLENLDLEQVGQRLGIHEELVKDYVSYADLESMDELWRILHDPTSNL